jgi:hypothetical protein
MHRLLPALVFLATASAFFQGSTAVELPFAADVSGAGNSLVLVGGMGGGTGGGMGGGAGAMAMPGGMGGMTGGGMGGMTGGGMSGGMGGMYGGMSGYGGTPGNSLGRTYDEADPSGGGAQPAQYPAQYYLCITPYDRCSFASSPGSRRSGSSCTCATGHRGTIK